MKTTVNIQAEKFNKHSYTKGSPEHDFICHVRILHSSTLKPFTDLYVFFFGGREFQIDDPENAKFILYRSMRVRRMSFLTNIEQALC